MYELAGGLMGGAPTRPPAGRNPASRSAGGPPPTHPQRCPAPGPPASWQRPSWRRFSTPPGPRRCSATG
eukprot:6382284-Alexandrium_andersonii.AAC.1